jgi:hypothetical protein
MNKHKGETPLTVGNKEYILKFTTNSLCELEDALKMSIPEMMEKMAAGMGFRDLRKILWAACLEHHSEVTFHEAGKMIDQVGFKQCLDSVTKALNAGFPDGKDSEEKKIVNPAE